MANETTVNRTFKSTLFIMVFEDKKNLLELYNAMTGKHYTDPEQLEINTLENAVYMSMKNDLSFLIDGRLSLYEPLLKLSDMYGLKVKDPKLELKATMLNISGSNNSRLKETCRTLRDYAIYTDKIRLYSKENPLAEAVERAIDECIAEDVLKDFLTKHKAEAKAMSIFEYDQEKHIRQEREEAWAEGRDSGLKLAETVFKLFREGKTVEEISICCDLPAKQIKGLLGLEK